MPFQSAVNTRLCSACCRRYQRLGRWREEEKEEEEEEEDSALDETEAAYKGQQAGHRRHVGEPGGTAQGNVPRGPGRPKRRRGQGVKGKVPETKERFLFRAEVHYTTRT